MDVTAQAIEQFFIAERRLGRLTLFDPP